MTNNSTTMQVLENLLLIAGLAVSLAGYAQLRRAAKTLRSRQSA